MSKHKVVKIGIKEDIFFHDSSPNGQLIGWARRQGGENVFQTSCTVNHTHDAAKTAIDWHSCLGHLPASVFPSLSKMIADPELLDKPLSNFNCSSCQLSKSTKTMSPSSNKRATSVLKLIHSDLSGKFSVPSIGGACYYITFIDDYSRFAWVFFLKKKSDAAETFKTFVQLVENQKGDGFHIKQLRSDNGGEYINNELSAYLRKKGISHENTAAYAHESNGVAERFNCTITTMARTSLIDSKLPKKLWAEAIAVATYTKNRLPHWSVPEMTPYEAFFTKKPSIGHLQPFGAHVYVHIPIESRPAGAGTKLDPRAWEGRFCGYEKSHHIYRIYNPSKGNVTAHRHLKFVPTTATSTIEFKASLEPPPSTRTAQLGGEAVHSLPIKSSPSVEHICIDASNQDMLTSEPDEEDTKPSNITSGSLQALPAPEPTLRRSTRESHPPTRYAEEFARLATDSREPLSYKVALASPDSDHWTEAMQEEISSLQHNETWTVITKPLDRNTVGCR